MTKNQRKIEQTKHEVDEPRGREMPSTTTTGRLGSIKFHNKADGGNIPQGKKNGRSLNTLKFPLRTFLKWTKFQVKVQTA